MPYRLRNNEAVGDGIRRIACEQIGRARAELVDPQADRHEAVHQARKRFKKVRAVLRLARSGISETYRFENTWYRDIARELSRLRDAEAVIESLDKLCEAFADEADLSHFAPLREALARRREELAEEDTDVEGRLRATAEKLRDASVRVSDWPISASGFDAVRGGLRRTYRRGRQALRAAYSEPTAERLHEWRKRVKYHWYHCRLIQAIWPRPMKARRSAVRNLGRILGDDHDLTVLRDTVTSAAIVSQNDPAIQELLGFIGRRREQLIWEARPLGMRVFAEKPKAFRNRMAVYWAAWERVDPLGIGERA